MKYLKKFNESIPFSSKKSFIWIHGLPGSGKSTLALQIKEDNPDKEYVVLDDIGSTSKILENIENESNIILTSPYYEEYNLIALNGIKMLNNILKNIMITK